MQPRITVSMPCYGRPQRTRRALDSILNQNIDNWEAFLLGDCCPDFDTVMHESIPKLLEARSRGNGIIVSNFDKNTGGCGYVQTNYAIQNATGKYFVFMANDDVILNYHFKYYLSQIEDTDYDFVYFNGQVAGKKDLNSRIDKWGKIGHYALIIKTDFLKEIPPHTNIYGHDFDLISNMIRAGAKYRKSTSTLASYKIMNWNTKARLDYEGLD